MVKLGLAYLNRGGAADPGFAAEIAIAGEEAGYDSVWASDHVAVPEGLAALSPNQADPRTPEGPGRRLFVDPFVFLSYLAAHTSRLLLATGVLVLPLRHPLLTAKAVSSLDHMSGGRAVLGVGVGWLEAEFRLLDADFAARGRTTDRDLALLRELWAAESFTPVPGERWTMEPRPPTGRVRIVVGGGTPRAAARAVAHGDGFFVSGGRAFELIDRTRSLLGAHGRDQAGFEITMKAPMDPAGLRAATRADRLLVPVVRGSDLAVCAGRPEDLAGLAERIHGLG
ncbi:TIGR03619 family F420-dependent LLM class oxidoreductase [Dactylosporangium roseum]|uniref:TIGR03619 family F420-dependent LLM class oxidoreductase n=1 Tax=Dactylosporangium roseum TaxID=47989 RepID=A0ABY5Z1G5_9ACTN|nr:TIGR03619 family F420-dependent LLM class oxidoreductase [Dactylosporangium roseum]UWZ35870.1 TIGR03619 family F420-dependent LLM class oxidoreductase [Dactylosporangium roseum]